MAIPNNYNFTLSDVCDETQSWSLDTAFQYAIACFFDSAYKGAKDRLSNFRNYRSKAIGSKVDTHVLVSGGLREECWIKADPDNNYLYTLIGDSGGQHHLEAFVCPSYGSLDPLSSYISLGTSTITDWCVADQSHIYIVDKYISGGYYFRLRWYRHDINISGGYQLVDSYQFTVTSTIYSQKRPAVAGMDGYVYLANFTGSTNHYVQWFSVGSGSFSSIQYNSASMYDDPIRAIYVENNVLYISLYASATGYVHSSSINSSTGYLTRVDSVITGPIITEFTGNGNTYLYFICEEDDVFGHITHNGSGNNLTLTSTTNLTSVRAIDYSKSTGLGVVIYSNVLMGTFCHDGNDDLQVFSNVSFSDGGNYYNAYRKGCCAMSQHRHIVGVGYYDTTWNPNDRVSMFSYPIA